MFFEMQGVESDQAPGAFDRSASVHTYYDNGIGLFVPGWPLKFSKCVTGTTEAVTKKTLSKQCTIAASSPQHEFILPYKYVLPLRQQAFVVVSLLPLSISSSIPVQYLWFPTLPLASRLV